MNSDNRKLKKKKPQIVRIAEDELTKVSGGIEGPLVPGRCPTPNAFLK